MASALRLAAISAVLCTGAALVSAARYSYSSASAFGPSNWATIPIDGATPYAACGSTGQSPVSLGFDSAAHGDSANMRAPDLATGAATAQVIDAVHDGAVLTLNYGRDGVFSRARDPSDASNPVLYTLEQIVVHSPAEHALAGGRFDAELQLQYTAPAGTRATRPAAVIFDILLTASPYAHHVELQRLFRLGSLPAAPAQPPPNDATNETVLQQDPANPDAFRFERLVPPTPDFMAYDGSVTRPPCTRNVRHVVFLQPVPIGAAQLAYLRGLSRFATPAVGANPTPAGAAFTGNARPLQTAPESSRYFRQAPSAADFVVPSTNTGTAEKTRTFGIVGLVVSIVGIAAVVLACVGISRMTRRLSDAVTEGPGLNESVARFDGGKVAQPTSVAAIAALEHSKKDQ